MTDHPATDHPATDTDTAHTDVTDVTDVTDHDVHGLVRVRLHGAPRRVREALVAELGAPAGPPEGTPDVTVRFTDELPVAGSLRLLGLQRTGFDDEHFYLLDPDGRRTRIDVDRLGRRDEIVCERGVDRVPLLIPVLGLHLLRRDHVLLHAASFVHGTRGVLVTGWQKGGKTETLLPFAAAGADYVSDEWTIVGGDPAGLYGCSGIARVWDWHLRQLPAYWARIRPRQRARLRAWRGYRRLYRAVPGLDRSRARPVRALRRLATDGAWRPQGVGPIDPAVLFGSRVWQGRAPLDRVLLPVVGRDGGTTVTPLDPAEVARRMVSSQAFERAALTTAYQEFRYAFPDRVNPLLETARERELRVLTRAFAGVPAYELRHPYPMRLRDLYEAAAPYC
ncbi:hypothetical protein [Geodermatophilus sp. URMC 62]|uniref:hypothetical protein n=1 Tax=Geodermatophilus sp. URMC 62 TaxID=3423414 RepID=UPI00406D1193